MSYDNFVCACLMLASISAFCGASAEMGFLGRFTGRDLLILCDYISLVVGA